MSLWWSCRLADFSLVPSAHAARSPGTPSLSGVFLGARSRPRGAAPSESRTPGSVPGEGSTGSGELVKHVIFGPKEGQIDPKWNKSGTFSDQISIHFGSAGQMY